MVTKCTHCGHDEHLGVCTARARQTAYRCMCFHDRWTTRGHLTLPENDPLKGACAIDTPCDNCEKTPAVVMDEQNNVYCSEECGRAFRGTARD